ncbi:MAG: hypothetical protein HOY79_33770 [Streptomyces sp.]|nr:hypothetical protein [Streptomyces sp.]NUS11339.1 hypothetical protein [Streptomyces sp.]NUS23386.1 hypothetical protein [Streptomyces sp.]
MSITPFIYNDLDGGSLTFHGGGRDDDGHDTVAIETYQVGRDNTWVHVRHADAARVADELRAAAGLPPAATQEPVRRRVCDEMAHNSVGSEVFCELDADHGGDHDAGDVTWARED